MIIDEWAKKLEQVLRDLGEPTKLSDILELTKEEIEWGQNPSNMMPKLLAANPNIQKVKFGHYGYVPQKKFDEKIMELKEEDKKLLLNFQNKTTPLLTKMPRKYKSGESFYGTVTGIESYGVFLEDDMEVAGLIHHSNIKRNIQVIDCNQYFKIGDKVTASVVTVKLDGKLSLSTYDAVLPDYFAKTRTGTATIADKARIIKEVPTHTPVKQVAIAPQRPKTELKKEEAVSSELDQLIRHLQDIVGVVSEPARVKLNQLIKEKGIVKFMLSMVEVEKTFRVDLGLKLLEEIEDKMSERL